MNPAQPFHATAADGAVPTAADRPAMPANAASITAVVTPAAARPLEYLPVGLFGTVMGLTGLGVAWRLAQARYGAPGGISDFFSAVAVIAFVVLCLGYAVKLVKAADAVRAELRHPIAGNMFGTFWVSLLLLPIVVAPVNLTLARALWVIGTAGMFVFAWALVSRWLSDTHQYAHATPAWIIPVVGLLDVPLAVPLLDWPELHGVMVLGLAVGLFFAVPLFTLVFSRLVFEPPMPDALQPSLLILVAPFAVGASAYTAVTGRSDLFVQSLYLLSLFMLAVLLGRLRHLGSCCPFRVAWWAVSFPLAAATITALHFAAANPGRVTDAISLLLLAFTTLVILGLLARTAWGVVRGELRTLSG